MNRRKSELLRKGLERRSKRFSQAESVMNYPPRAQTSQAFVRPPIAMQPIVQSRENTPSGLVSGSIRMRRVLQKKNRKVQKHEESLISSNQPGEETVRLQYLTQQVVANADYYGRDQQRSGVETNAMVSDRPAAGKDQPPGQTLVVNSLGTQTQGGSQAAIVVLNKSAGRVNDAGPSTVKGHGRTSTRLLIEMQGDGDSPSPDPAAKLAMVISSQTPPVHGLSQDKSQSTHRISTQEKSGAAMEPIKEMHELMRQNNSATPSSLLAQAGHSHEAIMVHQRSASQTSPDHKIIAAMNGQPAAGVGNEVQDKRDKIKQIYRAGRRKIAVPTHPIKRGLAKRPPVGATRNSSTLGGGGLKPHSINSFSVQGSGMTITEQASNYRSNMTAGTRVETRN